MGIGSLLFGSSGGGSSQIKPWSGAKGEMNRALDEMEDFYQSGDWESALGYGPYSAVPGMNPLLSQSFNQFQRFGNKGLGLNAGRHANTLLAQGKGTGLDAIGDPARSALEQTASGSMLFGNPGFNAAVDASLDAVLPRINSAFSGAGRTGSAYHAKTLGDAATRAFAGQYGQERANQLGAANTLGNYGMAGVGQQQQALGMIPGMASAAFMPAQMLGQAGAQQYSMFDAPGAAENVARYQQNARAPLDARQGYLGSALSAGGTGGTVSSGGGGSPGLFPMVMGAGLTAAGLGWNPFAGAGAGGMAQAASSPFMGGAYRFGST